MTTTPVTLWIDAGEVSPQHLSRALSAFNDLLAELDKEFSTGRKVSLRWRITDMRKGSAIITQVAVPLRHAIDISAQVIEATLSGFAALEAFGPRPPSFSDAALGYAKDLSSLVRSDTRAIRLDAPSMNLSSTITSRTAVHVEAVLGEGYTSIGDIEGTLETVTVHGRPYFTVYDAISGYAVHCYFEQSQLEAAKNALGLRVLVHGSIRRDPHGRPTTLSNIDQLRQIGRIEHEISSVRDLAGTYGGIGNVDQYLKDMRGE